MTDTQIYRQGIECFPLPRIILGNIVMLLWIGLGTIACWFVSSVVAWLYLAVAILMVFGALRKLVCTNCYYYSKRCPIGWGKLSALFFSQGNIDDFRTCAGVKVAPVTYGLLSLIPLVFCVVAIVQEVTAERLSVLVLLLLVSVYSGSAGRKLARKNCKMKLICPGSASK